MAIFEVFNAGLQIRLIFGKNQHVQIKVLRFVNRQSAKLSKSAKI